VSALADILRPDFLLRDALLGSVVVGIVFPLVGVYFVLRRMIFLGVALPQLSAAGIAFAFLLYSLIVGRHEHGAESEHALALAGSLGFTLLGLLALAALERGARETAEAHIGTAYALAAAATLLFVAVDPFGEAQIVNLLKGDVVATTGANLGLLLAVLAAVAGLLLAFRRELLLVSFDREMAIVLGKRADRWDAFLYVMIGLTICIGVTTVGPLVTFGFLVLPPLAARLVSTRMATFSLAASLLGGLAAFVGFYAAYRFDLPLGPTEVAAAGGVWILLRITRSLVRG
jgi:ABC-type Mn2+/Zn2+ transport system permease subunit